MKRAVIFVNGNLSDVSNAKKIIKKEDILIAVDGGAKHILKLGLIPHIVIGDFDSIRPELLKKYIKSGREQKFLFPTLVKYPRKKDKTDFELAIDLCLKRKFQEIIIFGILGDRIDHMFANILFVAKIQTENKSIKIKVFEGKKEIYFLDKEIELIGKIGDEVSIIPISQDIEGITTDGLYYRLIDDTLLFGSTRGISNVFNKNSINIKARKGTALVVHLRK